VSGNWPAAFAIRPQRPRKQSEGKRWQFPTLWDRYDGILARPCDGLGGSILIRSSDVRHGLARDQRRGEGSPRSFTMRLHLRCLGTGLKLGKDKVSLEPPSGSRISVTTDGVHPLIVVPHQSGGPIRYFVGLFLLVWLGGWFAGFSNAVSKLSSGQAPAMLVFWLVGWTLGGGFAVYWAYRVLRPSVPESLRLMPNSVTYDSGVPPLQTYGYTSRKDYWKSMFPKRTRTELDWQKLQSLRLREANDGNRLTVDVDALRLDIAQSASEIEREWLYQLLANRYSLPLGQGKTLADRRG